MTDFERRYADAGHVFGRNLARIVYQAKAVHPERVPATGPVLIVSNHTGFLDGPVIFCLAPRTVHFLVKRAYFTSVVGVLLRGVGQIPISQNTGDRQALADARSLLTRGHAVGIFPEGTRGAGAVSAAQQGTAWLALQTGATIVPAATLGTRGRRGKNSWPRPRSPIRVVFGEPFELPPYAGVTGRERLRLATELVRTRLAEQVRAAISETGLTLPGENARHTGEGPG
ncbi:1-acyl-sn-glycerol-3-phosphate acyltransferase [Calidifontibacter sp. DB0510]|uniref:1-acyl-sn-glycerol-3-phosphate acyltransferase n=1 Tax=Metallococcus carri TaxID=1656884 RepID=A0A967B498_9MICO|nr:lysophospholipid acyltransferase family protein [Metallococcus carri]NHN57010.1 1-acyl-sn-glycerol-3-phosphate acyltransferase [Metallococcus carri]NOP37755.1 1-acyl-sn-glycerol-3-phosphate acyltransferase [Calidifontibacter sp. DB2511S]